VLTPTRRTISPVPTPSAASNTIRTRCASPARNDGDRIHDANTSRSAGGSSIAAVNFRYGVSKATFSYLDQYTWHRVVRWIRKRHNRTKWAVLLRRYLPR
jgi:hypothetical protein